MRLLLVALASHRDNQISQGYSNPVPVTMPDYIADLMADLMADKFTYFLPSRK